MGKKTAITKPANEDQRIGKLTPQFGIFLGVRCNTCGGVLYRDSNDVEPEDITGALQTGVDTWKQSGSPHHRCRRQKRKEIEA